MIRGRKWSKRNAQKKLRVALKNSIDFFRNAGNSKLQRINWGAGISKNNTRTKETDKELS